MSDGMHGQMGPGMRGQMGPGMHGGPGQTQFDPARIDTLKTELGITAAQEPAWTKYAKAVQDAATAMKTTREGVDRDAVSKLSPADRFAFVTKIREQAQKQFETVQTAANELLATLDDAQKAKAERDAPRSRVLVPVPCGCGHGRPHSIGTNVGRRVLSVIASPSTSISLGAYRTQRVPSAARIPNNRLL